MSISRKCHISRGFGIIFRFEEALAEVVLGLLRDGQREHQLLCCGVPVPHAIKDRPREESVRHLHSTTLDLQLQLGDGR